MIRSGSNVIDLAPPDTGSGGGGGGWAWLLTARGLAEAQLVRGVLEGSGIAPIALDASDPSPGAWLFLSGNINALVRIYVPRSMLDEARLALLEIVVAEPDPVTPEEPARTNGGVAAKLMWIAVTLLVLTLYLVAVFRNPLMGT